VQLQGKFNHSFTNFSTDNLVNRMDFTVSISLQQQIPQNIKFKNPHFLYSPLMEQLSM